MKEGRDYRNTITYETAAVTNNVQLTWRWPKQPSHKCGVLGYNHIAWGNYDNGSTATSVVPRQVKSIGELTFAYGIDYAADPSEFNGLMEFYLTSAANRADLKKIEIGFFWQAPGVTQTWAKTTRQLGVFTDRYGKRWNVSREVGTSNGGYVTFVPFGGYQGYGTIDAKGAVNWLRGGGNVNGDWWFNGAARGVEPIKGFGIAIVRWFGATYR
ncbi:hypothetical protein SAMN05192583_2864 [Sphingomonas gellani]|uniref:Uncharacterized protein n=1 Tax=Sphingomonas gellani TaxID=1166340 RepID=A0A1H8GQP9_9SPHN|nr:hypothetical protein [Sphingomonas gellani]SEN46441.1 hypothetical protein SAMN05192583_2864 [Sphingomonas gellani]